MLGMGFGVSSLFDERASSRSRTLTNFTSSGLIKKRRGRMPTGSPIPAATTEIERSLGMKQNLALKYIGYEDIGYACSCVKNEKK